MRDNIIDSGEEAVSELGQVKTGGGREGSAGVQIAEVEKVVRALHRWRG